MYLKEYECSPSFLKVANLGAMQSLVDYGALNHLGKFIYNDQAKNISFKTPYFYCEANWHTLYNLYEIKKDEEEEDEEEQAKVYAVFDPTSKETIQASLKQFYDNKVTLYENYKKPTELLIPLHWLDENNEKKDNVEQTHKRAMWWLVRVKLTYDKNGMLEQKKEVIVYGRQSNEEQLNAIQELLKASDMTFGKRIKNLFSKNQEENVAEDFNPEDAKIISIDDGAWVTKNIVTVAEGQEPKTSDLFDASKPYSHYFSMLNQLAVSHQKNQLELNEESCVQLFSHIAESFDQKPPSLWERYRTTIILLGAIAAVTIIVSAFAAAFPAFFATHFVYGFAGLVNISAAAIGVLTTTQIAFITAGIIATFSALAAGLGMLIKAGVEYVVSLRQPKENEYTLINLETQVPKGVKGAIEALSQHRMVMHDEKKGKDWKGKEEESDDNNNNIRRSKN